MPGTVPKAGMRPAPEPPDPRERPATLGFLAARIGLVLAGGGVTGMAFHSGALAALEETTGWDPRTAALIVGTSAGSIAGSILRLGVPTSDQLARASGQEPSAATRALFERAGQSGITFPTLSPPRSLEPVDREALARALTRRGRNRRVALLAAAIPEGTVETTAMRSGFAALFDAYPEGLWICAVRISDGALVVFGRDVTDVTVADAIAASSAIPGIFKPVEIGGERYVDGGLRSMANADLVVGQGLDAVIVSSPLTFRPPLPDAVADRLASPLKAHLRWELRKVRRSGIPVIVLEPDAAVRQVMGMNPMNPERRFATTLAAHESVRTRLATSDIAAFTSLL